MTPTKTAPSRTDLILHPVRLRLLTELTGRSLTTKQLAEALPDLPQASLYRHIKILVEGGIFETTAEQQVNGATERTYAVAKGQGRLTGEELSDMTAAEHRDAFQLFLASFTERFSRYIEQAELDRLAEDGLSYNGTVIYLSDQEKAQLRERMMALIGEFASPGPSQSRRRYTLGSIVIPDERNAP